MKKSLEKYLKKKSIFSGENKTEVYLRRNQLIASIKVMNLVLYDIYILIHFFCIKGSTGTLIYIKKGEKLIKSIFWAFMVGTSTIGIKHKTIA